MNSTDIAALRERLENLVRQQWEPQDADLEIFSTIRADNKIDMRVVSHLFEGKDGLEREAFFYPVFAPVAKTEMLYMTYCLLLTPNEAARNFAAPYRRPGEDNADEWS